LSSEAILGAEHCHFEDNKELVKSEHFRKSRSIIVENPNDHACPFRAGDVAAADLRGFVTGGGCTRIR
jgi:hypothetical protein